MCKEVPLDAPETAPSAKEWDGMTVETFKEQTLWTNSMLFIHVFVNILSSCVLLRKLLYCLE